MLELEAIHEYCASKPGVSEDFPFDEKTLTMKVMGKVFMLTDVEQQCPARLNLKCDPARAIALRAEHPAISPGYHMNKKHWNTVTLDHTISQALAFELIDHSYALVVKGLRKADRDALSS